MITYQNVDLEVFDHQQTADADHFKVRVSASPAGQQRIFEAEPVILPGSARRSILMLKSRRFTFPEMIKFGMLLGDALFPPRARDYLKNSLIQCGEDRLRIRLKLDTYGLAELPWEYVYIPQPGVPEGRRGVEGFLALDHRISLVRYEAQEGPEISTNVGVSPIRLVALMANPKTLGEEVLDPLEVEKERETIAGAVSDLSTIQHEFHSEATVDTLLDVFSPPGRPQPVHIFHFSGHGKFDGDMSETYDSPAGNSCVILEDGSHRGVRFSAQKLARNLSGRGIRLAVLTACEVGRPDAENAWSGVVTALTHAGIPAVVGMQFRILDTNAVAFSRAFYRALAAGQSIDEAVSDGRFAIFNHGDDNERDWGNPVLYLRSKNGELFPQGAQKNTEQPPARSSAQPASASPGRRPPPPSSPAVDKRALRDAMMVFSMDELELLCSDVQHALEKDGYNGQVNLDIIGPGGKAIRILNLIEYLNRRGYLPYLVNAVRENRPGII